MRFGASPPGGAGPGGTGMWITPAFKPGKQPTPCRYIGVWLSAFGRFRSAVGKEIL